MNCVVDGTTSIKKQTSVTADESNALKQTLTF